MLAEIDTRNVLVNGSPATYVAWQGTWTAGPVALSPGINTILVQSDPAEVVPEPSAWMLALSGIGAVGYELRRRMSALKKN